MFSCFHRFCTFESFLGFLRLDRISARCGHATHGICLSSVQAFRSFVLSKRASNLQNRWHRELHLWYTCFFWKHLICFFRHHFPFLTDFALGGVEVQEPDPKISGKVSWTAESKQVTHIANMDISWSNQSKLQYLQLSDVHLVHAHCSEWMPQALGPDFGFPQASQRCPDLIGCWLAQVCAAVLWVKSWNDEGSPSNLLRRVQKEHVQLVKAPSASTSSTSITCLFGIIQYAHCCQQTLRPHYRCLRQLSTRWAEIHLQTANVQKHECRTQIWKLCNTGSRELVGKDTSISNKAAAKIDHIKEYPKSQCHNVHGI